MKPASGLCASYTTSRAILSDAVSLVRSDRFYTVDYTPQNLTNWGFNAASYDLNINHGCVFYKLVLNAFPNHISKNSIYAHYPLVIPPENKLIHQDLKRDKLYDFEAPAPKLAPLLNPSAELKPTVMADSSKFDTLWTTRAPAFGGPSEKASPASTSFAEAFMANDKWKSIATKYYSETLERLWKEKQCGLGDHQQVDVVGEVLNAAHVGFVTSVLGIPEDSTHDRHGILPVFGEIFEQAFGKPQPNSLVSKVRDTTQWLAGAIEARIDGTSSNESDAKQAELGQSVYTKLAGAGNSPKQAAWQDVLPTTALLLNTLCRLSAQTVEFFLEDKEKLAEAQKQAKASTKESQATLDKLAHEATRVSSNITLAMKAVASTSEAEKGQVVVVNVKAPTEGSPSESFKLDRDEQAYSMKAYGPEVDLAYKVTYISNTVMTGILVRQAGIERVPGPQGRLKKVRGDTGNVTYLNAEESEYVPYPTSLKVRWSA
jgi:hypothetical protein